MLDSIWCELDAIEMGHKQTKNAEEPRYGKHFLFSYFPSRMNVFLVVFI